MLVSFPLTTGYEVLGGEHKGTTFRYFRENGRFEPENEKDCLHAKSTANSLYLKNNFYRQKALRMVST